MPLKLFFLAFLLCISAHAQRSKKPTTYATTPTTTPTADPITAKVTGMKKLEGYIPLYWDDATGKLWMSINLWHTDILYQTALTAGVGSNDIGLDRMQVGPARVVQFRRVGPRVLLVQRNLDYRAVSTDSLERRTVAESFAESTLWGFEVAAASGSTVLVDATAFFVRDVHDVAGRLAQARQGNYSFDASRSALYLPRTRNYADNTEVEASITVSGSGAGAYLQSVTPSSQQVSTRQHHSLVRLPELGSYTPRRFDPRAGYYSVDYFDYATPIDQPINQQFIARHRLDKKDPTAARSEAVQPIVYYLDPGTPEPIRSALMQGAAWWNEAFDAAGFINAFRVEVLPPDADPMDIRYNMIHWVHRSTRGWSYGYSITDPRTGQILKGNVNLGSLRVRQDFLIASALLAAYGNTPDTEPHKQLALARLRQLAAHEVGHTLGLVHNYYASSQGRASVMDYPHPNIRLLNGQVDFSQAYATGMGAWDKLAIRWGYATYPDAAAEKRGCDAIIQEGIEQKNVLLSDDDARDPAGAHPQAHLWDEGNDAVAELHRLMLLRAHALTRFGQANIPLGTPLAKLEESLVPLYLLHRYQADAVVRLVGGLHYVYNLRGDGQPLPTPLDKTTQLNALQALLNTLKADALALPKTVLASIPPRPLGHPRTRETFASNTGPTFDAIGPAEAYANSILGLLLHPARLYRIHQHHILHNTQPSLQEVLELVYGTLTAATSTDTYAQSLQHAAALALLRRLLLLQCSPAIPAVVQQHAAAFVQRWRRAAEATSTNTLEQYHHNHVLHLIADAAAHPELYKEVQAAPPPPGQPIGCDE